VKQDAAAFLLDTSTAEAAGFQTIFL